MTMAALEGLDLRLEQYDDTLTRQMVEQVWVVDTGTAAVKFTLGPENVCRLSVH